MKCLVTGGAGFIGSHLVEELINHGNEVVVFDNLSTGKNENLIKSLGAELLVKDIVDFESLNKSMEDIDVVFHLAAMNRAERSVRDPLASHQVNATGTLNVLEAARKNNVNKVVFSSSSSVYGSSKQFPRKEERFLMPSHPYAVSKATGENYCKVYNEIYGIKTVILRYFSVYGPRQRHDIDYPAVIPLFIHKILNDDALNVYGNGNQTRNFTYVKDCVNATISSSIKKEAEGETINIASSREYSINELITILENIIGKKARVKYLPKRAGDPIGNAADITKAKKILKYSQKFSFEEGLKETIKNG